MWAYTFQLIIWLSSGRPNTYIQNHNCKFLYSPNWHPEFALCALNDVSNCDFDLDVFGLPEDDHIIGSNM